MDEEPEEDAKARVKMRATLAAFTPEYSDVPILHCFLGGIGADWTLTQVLSLIDEARSIAWVEGIAGHDLAVTDQRGKTHLLNVPRPVAPDKTLEQRVREMGFALDVAQADNLRLRGQVDGFEERLAVALRRVAAVESTLSAVKEALRGA